MVLEGQKRGGERKMDAPTVLMEVERVMNLVRGFGWDKVKEEVIGDEIHISMKKKSAAAATAVPPAGPS